MLSVILTTKLGATYTTVGRDRTAHRRHNGVPMSHHKYSSNILSDLLCDICTREKEQT